MLKKIIALALVAVICLLTVGCGSSDTPKDMKKSSLEGEPFILYVPEGWVENSKSGLSSAYYISSKTIAVSARYETVADTSVTVDKYIESYASKLASTVKDFNMVSLDAAVLGGKDARDMKYTMSREDGVSLTNRLICVRHGEDMVSLNFYCETELYEANSEQFKQMADVFVLTEKKVVNDNVTDKHTPDGMKIASSDNIEYRLYVPTNWICDSTSGRSEAYYPTSSRPNVTVTSYTDSDATTPEGYFAELEKEYAAKLSGFELLGTSEKKTVGGRDAVSYTYRVEYDGVSFRIMQTVLIYLDNAYSITYTALDEDFEEHLSDVEKILEAFRFR